MLYMEYRMARKFYMEFNFTVSDRTVKLKSVNWYLIKREMSLLKYFSYKSKNNPSFS